MRSSHEYISPAIRIPLSREKVTLDWKGENPHKTAITFEIRTAATQASLEDSLWSALERNTSLAISQDSEFLEYRAILMSPDGGNTPLLREVILSFE